MFPTKILTSLLLLLLLIPIVSSDYHSSRRSLQANTDKNAANQTKPQAPPRFAREFLHAHNKHRMNFNHPTFKWDKMLARYARRWGSKRALDCKMIHSYGPYGENLFWGGRDHWTPTEAVNSWAGESEFYDAERNACAQGQICGHYTQIVWRDSLKLGCARVKCANGGVLVICEYDPPGNYVDESPFVSAAVDVNSPPSTGGQASTETNTA